MDKDFQNALDRIATLEKKVSALFARGGQQESGNSQPNLDLSGGGEYGDRINALEEALKDLQAQLNKSHAELQDQINGKLDFN